MKKETKVKIVKIAVGLVVGACAATVVTTALKGLLPVAITTTEKVVNKIGVSVISSLVADQAGNYAAQLVGVLLAPAMSLPMAGSMSGMANA